MGVDCNFLACSHWYLPDPEDLKGVVAKHKDGIYAPSAKWLKIKNPTTRKVRGDARCLSQGDQCVAPTASILPTRGDAGLRQKAQRYRTVSLSSNKN